MRTCTKCGIEQNESEFFYRNKAKGILHNFCKSCKRAVDRKAYSDSEDRRNKMRKTSLSNISRNRKYVNDIKQGLVCSKCGESRWYVIDFHHLTDKEFNISFMVRQGASLKRIKKEIDKCILLCANCHREEHYFGIVAPMVEQEPEELRVGSSNLLYTTHSSVV